MSCRQSEAWMMDALDGTLAAADHQRLQAHLESCLECRADWVALSAVDEMLASTPMVFPAPHFVERVEARLDHFEAQRRTLIGGLMLLGAAAALCLLAVPSLLNGRNPLEAYGAFLQNTYGVLGNVAHLSYRLVSATWLVLDALARSADVPLINVLTYSAVIILALVVWRRTLVAQTARVRMEQNGH